jgi:metal-sulfur cluster biosynthetic enzyme
VSDSPFPYDGPEDLRQPVIAALSRVVDPEVALNIVDIGLVYGVRFEADRLELLLTMTSAACPVADVIVDDATSELERVLPPEVEIAVQMVWEPAWTPERMSERARRFMRW